MMVMMLTISLLTTASRFYGDDDDYDDYDVKTMMFVADHDDGDGPRELTDLVLVVALG